MKNESHPLSHDPTFEAELEAAFGALRGRQGGCPDAETLVQFASGELQPEKATELRQHIGCCGVCEHLLITVKKLEDGLTASDSVPVPAGWSGIEKRLRRALHDVATRQQASGSSEALFAIAPQVAGAGRQKPGSAARAKSHIASASVWEVVTAFLAGPQAVMRLAFAVVGLAAIVVSSWLIIENQRLRDAVAQLQSSGPVAPRQQKQEPKVTEGLAPTSGTGPASVHNKGLPQVEAVTPPAVALLLTPGLVRGSGGQKLLVVPPGESRVRLKLALEHDDYASYRASIEAVEGDETWQKQRLQSQTYREGYRVITLRPPADFFKSGDYIVELQGIAPDGTVQDLASYSFRVEKH